MTSSPHPPDVGGRPDPIGGTAALGGEPAPTRGYLLDNARTEAGERFVWLAELFDGITRGHFDRLGVRVGSRCWEVGAGGPGIPAALAAAVGPSGHVLATDIDPSWLTAGAGYEVRRHDVAADPPPEPGTFDLVHARVVLVHVPDRARAMAAALRPGGWLLVEDADTALQPLACLDDSGPAQRRANRLRNAVRELMARRGADLSYGRTLPTAPRAAGLAHVAASLLSLAANTWSKQNHDVKINSGGPHGQVRFECSCGHRGLWHPTAESAERMGKFHRMANL